MWLKIGCRESICACPAKIYYLAFCHRTNERVTDVLNKLMQIIQSQTTMNLFIYLFHRFLSITDKRNNYINKSISIME